MKKYYLFLIILFALKCSIIAQKVEPSRTYNLIEECYCTSFKQVGKLYNGTIVYVCTKCGKETTANPNGVGGTIEDLIEQNKREAKLAEMLKNPSASGNEETLNNMLGDYQSSAIDELSNEHYCVSFKFIDENPTGIKNYECLECGHKVKATEEWTISDIIADNKERMRIGNTALDLLKNSQQKTQLLQKNQKLSNQQKPKTTSKPQGKTTSKPSTTTKKPQTNLDIPSVNKSSSEVDVKQPKPTVEENLCKVSDGIDAAIDMVKKISNKDGTNNTTLKENYNPIQESALKEALRYNNKSNPNYDRNKKWSGKMLDVLDVAAKERKKFGLATDIHETRNIGVPLPYLLNDMKRELLNGNPNGFYIYLWDQHHQDNEENTFGIDTVKEGHWVKIEDPIDQLWQLYKMKEEGVQQYVKFQNPEGHEVVYNLQTDKADLSNKLGTYNKGKWLPSHWWYDMHPNENGEEYLYAGVFYSYNQDGTTVEIINAQTGKPMTGEQVEKFATSYSNAGQQRKNNNSASSKPKNSVFGK